MPRMTGSRAAKFPSETHYRGLDPVVDGIEVVSGNVSDLTDMQEAGNTELERIRRGNELIVGQDIEDGD